MAGGAVRRIVLAYSGGLDTSVILRWLGERYAAEVIAYCADLGQAEELAGLPERARGTGAVKTIVEDLLEEFVRDYVFPIFRAGAIYESQYLLGTSIARPLIAKRQVEVARREGADAVAHGATGKGNDQVRFELTYAALAPELTVIAPWREWDFKGRNDLIAYAERHRIPITVTAEKPYSSDRNLLHVSYEGGILEDPWRAP
jgi:argininosuccinate synthase